MLIYLMKSFRKLITSSGKEILAGRDENSNEELIKQIKNDEIVLHSAAPGSPFVNIKAENDKITKEDLKEAAIFCAVKSHDWRDHKKDVKVHWFKGRDIFKEKGMKIGTFGVKKFKLIKVKKKDIENFVKKFSNSRLKNQTSKIEKFLENKKW